jgi:hypothetical protein
MDALANASPIPAVAPTAATPYTVATPAATPFTVALHGRVNGGGVCVRGGEKGERERERGERETRGYEPLALHNQQMHWAV